MKSPLKAASHDWLRRALTVLGRRAARPEGARWLPGLVTLRNAWLRLDALLPNEPVSTSSLLGRARLCLTLGLRVAGFRLYLSAYRREPDNAAVCREIAQACLTHLDDAELASAWLDHAEQPTRPAGLEACQQLARLRRVAWGVQPRSEQAAAKTTADVPSARQRGAAAYYQHEDVAGALLWLERALRRAGHAPSGFLAASIAWYHQSDAQRARRLLAATFACPTLAGLEPHLAGVLLEQPLRAPAAAAGWYLRGWRERHSPACAHGLARLASDASARQRWLLCAQKADRQGLAEALPALTERPVAPRGGDSRPQVCAQPVAIISIPKSGTHLLGRLLAELGLFDSELLILPRHCVDRAGLPFAMARYYPVLCGYPALPDESLGRVRAGAFAMSHLPCSAVHRESLQGFKCIFLQRDLRACIASLLHHRTQLRRDEWALKKRLHCEPGRPALLEFLIAQGRAESRFWQRISAWREQAEVFCLDYEGLTGVRGAERQLAVVSALIRFLGVEPVPEPAGVLARSLGVRTLTSAGKRPAWQECWSPLLDELFTRQGFAALNRALGYGDFSAAAAR